MSLKTKATKGGGGEKPDIEAGSHQAVVVAVVDLGTQTAQYKDKPPESKHQVYFAFEVPDVAGPGAGCLVLGKALNLTLHEKATMRQFVEACRGKKLDDGQEVELKKLLGCNCLLDVSINENGYPKIEGALSLVKGMAKKQPSRTPFYWDMDEGGTPELPDWLPKHYGKTIAEVIEGSEEVSAAGGFGKSSTNGKPDDEAEVGEEQEESIPF